MASAQRISRPFFTTVWLAGLSNLTLFTHKPSIKCTTEYCPSHTVRIPSASSEIHPLDSEAYSLTAMMRAFKKRIAPVSASTVHGIGGKDVPPAAHLSGLKVLPGARPPERKSVIELLYASKLSFSVVQHAEAFCSQLVRFRSAIWSHADSRLQLPLATAKHTTPHPHRSSNADSRDPGLLVSASCQFLRVSGGCRGRSMQTCIGPKDIPSTMLTAKHGLHTWPRVAACQPGGRSAARPQRL